MKSRRELAREEASVFSAKEMQRQQHALAKEQHRRQVKQSKRERIKGSRSYRCVDTIATWCDRYKLEALLGLLPSVGDSVSLIAGLPALYVALFQVRSIPLTLAVMFNNLVDCLLGMIPFFVGDVLDFLHQSNVSNMRLIKGFVDDDREIIGKVNRQAVWMAVAIVLVIAAIVGMFFLLKWIFTTLFSPITALQ